MSSQKYGTKEDVERMIKMTRGDNAGLLDVKKKPTKKKTTAQKPAAKKK